MTDLRNRWDQWSLEELAQMQRAWDDSVNRTNQKMQLEWFKRNCMSEIRQQWARESAAHQARIAEMIDEALNINATQTDYEMLAFRVHQLADKIWASAKAGELIDGKTVATQLHDMCARGAK